jgi:hypothetical protein
MVERSRRISAGETDLIPPLPKNDVDQNQAVAIVNMLLEYGNPQGKIIRDPEKCIYPKCTRCMDHCTMDYIDLACTRRNSAVKAAIAMTTTNVPGAS